MRNRVPLLVSVAAYATAVLVANVLSATFRDVSVGFGLTASAGTYAAGFALLARDFVHRFGGVRWAILAVLIGSAASFLLATPGLAVASALAFLAAEVVDLCIFAPLRRRSGFVRAAFVSNLVSAPVDTFAFLWLAGFGLAAPIVAGQLVGKLVWATVIPLFAWMLATRDGRTEVAA